jgi:hypothetical protein
MRIGIISEGRPDQAVIENILDGVFEDFEPILLRPDLKKDVTDVQLGNSAAAGGLSRVKTDCEEKILFEKFFDQMNDGKDFLIIQLDTDNIEESLITRPSKKENKDYVKELRVNVIEKIKEWLSDTSYDENLVFAISVEELEAWMLPIFESRNSISYMNPKTRLKRILRTKNKSTAETPENYSSLSKPFKKKKELTKCAKHNESLQLFIDDLEKQFEIEE